MKTEALNNLWSYLKSLPLTSSNRKWLADRLIEPDGLSVENDASAVDQPSMKTRIEITPRVQSFRKGRPVYFTDEEAEQMRYEYLEEKYK